MRRRHTIETWGVALAVVLLSSCGGIRVASEFDRTARANRLQTYAWVDAADPAAADPVDGALDAEVRAAVDAELVALGARLVADAEADAIVGYHTVVESRVRSNDPYFDFYVSEQIEIGTLVIDLLDGATREPFWRGKASSELRVSAVPVKPLAHRMSETGQRRQWKIRDKVAAIFAELRAQRGG